MSYEFHDKVVLVSGDAGGVGSALCRRFPAGGARCIAVDVEGARAKRLADDLPGRGHMAEEA